MPRAIKRNNVCVRARDGDSGNASNKCNKLYSCTHTHTQRPGRRVVSRHEENRRVVTSWSDPLETFTKVFVVFSFHGGRHSFLKSPRLPTMFLSAAPFLINSPPALLAERKWLLLAIASYMSLCNATEHSLFKKKKKERKKDWLALETLLLKPHAHRRNVRV